MRRIRNTNETPHPGARGLVAWRVALATIVNYGLCALVAAAAGRLLPRLGAPRIEAAASGELLAVVLLPVIPIFVFAARDPRRPTLAMGSAITGLALILRLAGAAP